MNPLSFHEVQSLSDEPFTALLVDLRSRFYLCVLTELFLQTVVLLSLLVPVLPLDLPGVEPGIDLAVLFRNTLWLG